MLAYGRVDILRWVEYDALKLKGGQEVEESHTIAMFSKPMSFDKNKGDTNLYLSARLPDPQHFNCTHSKIALDLTNLEEDNNYFRSITSYEFMIGSKVYDQGPMLRYGPFIDGKEDFPSLVRAAKEAQELGAKIPGNMIDYRIGNDPIGHHILQGQMFYVNIYFHKPWIPKSDFRFIYFLEGVLARSAQ